MDKVIYELNRCNQRSERMLSVIDLLNAGACSADMAAYIAEGVFRGASLLVGAKPSGGGKTTVMAAFLAFVPADTVIIPVESAQDIEGLSDSSRNICFLSHEIGSGHFYAYVWGEEARLFFSRAGSCQIASNLHADTLEQAEDIILNQNSVKKEDLARIRFLVFLEQGRSGNKKFSRVYESGANGRSELSEPLTLNKRQQEFKKFLLDTQKKGIYLIEEVRSAFLK
ncbi:hypothetical protein COY52_05805 [Candidatus Desantisbacteria bacterium CG_4_10_14_0_8_um_filter_48_22]|uniref:Bacterial type II secretion system protein E domain-containing protein n=1 Tax=Candidatus Desantisbacteria bacterium CG_4_10_14_0_8_um_filter_48_22 TaxID=1974543 RepID=A0A2M7SBG0_9BACT|nr:MAG: hypothetical protein AUJ67_08000 [Candidatus Desantisbacteria bacterium CG1_02_49_89]PIV55126.1 MAG: hypothetical protein COS16_08245 [Candidatus Desantisbacteria bacterium CG02_land_8_20_14_3_00_49_13]PIZ16886.1 MAG: hypothetical protein COY52_05805 [Candidatus Desantisbacteria bacterium CG_4_10_14_0_8_um_filter_48_22]PJB27448.1 MAG: hypothetical protein CO111_05290 [Candidatus Desantisbacteria bacterium CG_4_9_14_3_um_filter_50_7]